MSAQPTNVTQLSSYREKKILFIYGNVTLHISIVTTASNYKKIVRVVNGALLMQIHLKLLWA